jgi:uncharacterized protein YoaH (UPF0181 family)
MAPRAAAELEELLDRMENGSVPSDSNSRSEVIGRVAKLFGVKEDEVAIMELGPSGRTLRFVMPEKLRQVGSIPISSNTALASRTARERRSDIINNFSSARHASVFEAVPLGRNSDEAIQKIMSAPILSGEAVIGVAQICRKGASPMTAGPDFSSRDLSELTGINQTLCRFLALCRDSAAAE